MDKCIAITCGRRGDVWLVDSFEQADLHPLIQYGDAILQSEDDVFKQFNELEIPGLLLRLNKTTLRDRFHVKMNDVKDCTSKIKHKILQEFSTDIWNLLMSVAQPILNDPELICN